MPLTEEEIDQIAQKAAEKALNIVYQEVGKSVIRKMAWTVGVVLLGLLAWLSTKGFLK